MAHLDGYRSGQWQGHDARPRREAAGVKPIAFPVGRGHAPLIAVTLLLLAPVSAAADRAPQTAISPAPDHVALTVYRDPGRDVSEAFDLSWLDGYALVTERRTIDVPAGEATIRFEGVAGGILPQSAIVTGLPEGILEKNRDSWLLAPGSLLDASLGRRVRLRRTSRATGKVRETEAVIRSAAENALVLETAAGIESLRCTGLPETTVYPEVPDGLSARPTLSVRTRSTAPFRGTVTLSYLAGGFDWQANYVAELSRDRTRLDLFAWLTLANGDETGFVSADTQAIAGKVNYDSDRPPEAEAPPLRLRCWPQGTTTSDLVERRAQRVALPRLRKSEDIVVTAESLRRVSAASVADSVVLREDLGDLKLYRFPEAVTVAARSQKQVALLRHENVPVDLVYRFVASWPTKEGARPTLLTRNRARERLGVPLPGGPIDLYETARGRRLLVGRGEMRDLAVGEDVEIDSGRSIDVVAELVREREDGQVVDYRLSVSNAKSRAVRFEALLPAPSGATVTSTQPLGTRDGRRTWAVTVPANATAELRYRISKPD
jgi:hypothetical protein